MNEFLAAALTVVGGATAGAGAQWLRDRAETKKASSQSNAETHKADLENDAQFQERLLKRIEVLETRLTKQENETIRMGILLERVGNSYEQMRKLQFRVARKLRANEPVDEDTLLEMEQTPGIEHVLAGPISRRELPQAES